MTGTLYIVALPIGNIQDLSPHAIQVLQQVQIIACEDTRTFKELCSEAQLKLKAQLVSYHDHNEGDSAPELLKRLLDSDNVAIVSDAGTPGISDPGHDVVKLAFENNVPVRSVAGPSALTSALSVTPIGGASTLFLGFPKNFPRDFKKALQSADRVVVFESPHRLLEHFTQAKELLGNILISVHRELSKNYEESLYQTLDAHIAHFQKNPPKGEFVLVYPGLEPQKLDLEELRNQIQTMLDEKIKDSRIAQDLAAATDLGRKAIYKIIQDIKKK